MSRSQLISTIRVELNWLNRLIDQKIVRGEPYRTLARRHKSLVNQLSRV